MEDDHLRIAVQIYAGILLQQSLVKEFNVWDIAGDK